MTIVSTAESNKPIQLAEQGQANPEESQRIRKALQELPAVEVKSLEDAPRRVRERRRDARAFPSGGEAREASDLVNDGVRVAAGRRTDTFEECREDLLRRKRRRRRGGCRRRGDMLRLGGGNLPTHELQAEAKEAMSDKPMKLVQWVRFGPGFFIRMVGIARGDQWQASFPRFRAVRDGVGPRD